MATAKAKTPQVRKQLAPGATDPIVQSSVNAGTEVNEDPAAADDETITVTVPTAFKLTLADYSIKAYDVGIQEMPASHADHWFAKANGVTPYTK